MKKLAGTRAGKPFYIAFDLEMIIQAGCPLFRTDQAILSPDWIPNEAVICVYHAGEREFWWSNRAYASCRKAYNEKLKEMKDRHAFGVHALDQSKRGIANDLLLERWGDFLNGAQLGKVLQPREPEGPE